MSRRAIFICSQKGGAGKTTFARGLVECLRAEGQVCAAFDADGQVGQLLQHEGERDQHGDLKPLQDPLTGCAYFDIRDDDDRDILINALSLDAPLIVFDLPGGVVMELGKVIDEGALPDGLVGEYSRAGYAVTVVIVMTPVLASVRTVQTLLHCFIGGVDFVAVKNLAFGAIDDFVLFDGIASSTEQHPISKGKQALQERGGKIITLPALKSRTYALLDMYSLRFVDAINDERMPRADQMRVRQWLFHFGEGLASASVELGFASEAKLGINSNSS